MECGSSFLKCGSSNGGLWPYAPIYNTLMTVIFSSLLLLPPSYSAASSSGYTAGFLVSPVERYAVFFGAIVVEADAKPASLRSIDRVAMTIQLA